MSVAWGYAASLQAGVVKVSGERGVFHDGDAPTSISPSTLWAMSSCHAACHRHHGDPELYLERLPSSGPWALPYWSLTLHLDTPRRIRLRHEA